MEGYHTRISRLRNPEYSNPDPLRKKENAGGVFVIPHTINEGDNRWVTRTSHTCAWYDYAENRGIRRTGLCMLTVPEKARAEGQEWVWATGRIGLTPSEY